MTATLTPGPSTPRAIAVQARPAPDPARRTSIAPTSSGVVQALLCAVAATLTAWPYTGFFGGDAVLLRIGGAAAAGSAVAVVVAMRRGWVVLLSWAAGFVVTAALLARPAGAGEAPWSPLVATVAGVRHGWSRMLAVNLPADPLPELLVLPMLATWTASFAAVVLARRTQVPLVPVIPSVPALVLALLLSAARYVPQPAAAVALVLVFALLAGLRVHLTEAGHAPSTPAGPGGGGRRAAGLALLVVTLVVALMATVAVQRLPTARGPADVRSLTPPEVRVSTSVTPLKLVKPQLNGPGRPLFTVRASGGARIDRIRIATLDRYDGTAWTSDARYRVTGRVLSTLPPPPSAGKVALHVVLGGITGPFLPVAGEPDRITGDLSDARTGFDPLAGTLVRAGAFRPGLSYDVTGVYSAVGDLDESDVPAVTPENVALAQAPGDVPAELRSLESQLSAGVRSPYEQLLRFQTYLRRQPYSLATPPGHSYEALSTLLTGGPSAAGHAEQHAAAFALLARIAGRPTRVAVGYRLPDGARGTVTITTHQAHAWPEVWFPRHGWVAFEPTDPEQTAAASPPGEAPGSPDAEPDTPAAASGADRDADPGGAGDGGPLPLRLLLGGLLLAVVLLLTSIPVAKRLQRWSRRRGPPGRRLLGAEATVHDLLAERAFAADPPFDVTPADTSLDVAARAEVLFGPAASPLRGLATEASALRFGAGTPDAAAADRAWDVVRQVRRDLDTGVAGLGRRLRAEADPRPLWRRARLGARATRAVERGRAVTAP